MSDKVSFSGTIIAVQPRIRLLRSFDQRSHTYQGYILRVEGQCAGTAGSLVVAMGEAAQKKHGFRSGDLVSGEGEPVADDRTEVAELYKVVKLKKTPGPDANTSSPPWLGVPPSLEVYRARGHRRLDAVRALHVPDDGGLHPSGRGLEGREGVRQSVPATPRRPSERRSRSVPIRNRSADRMRCRVDTT